MNILTDYQVQKHKIKFISYIICALFYREENGK